MSRATYSRVTKLVTPLRLEHGLGLGLEIELELELGLGLGLVSNSNYSNLK
jgi:shikimate kinase